MNRTRKVWRLFAFIAVFAASIAIVMLLWNALLPSLIGWSVINYWQAAGLVILSRILLGGLGHHWHGRGFFHSNFEQNQFHNKLKGMSIREKREYIRKHLAEYHNFDGCRSSSADAEEKKNDE
ncbi:hypothetical protein EZS27_029016 [termite gut metagenome]|uniref:Uncharacterized protein n=1 Tax=termite gut metagenome TaxID=433724 RepID=A0A5J4QL17_9ZZZZ